MNTQHLRLNRFTSPLNIGEIFFALSYRQIYLAAEHRRDFLCLIIPTDLPRRWTSPRFSLPYYTDRVTSPLNIGEISVASLYRQNYLAAEHRRDFLCLIIQTELPRRWTSARFRLLHYTDRITSLLNIGEISVASLYKTELPRCWTSARFRLLHYTERITSPLNIGEILVIYKCKFYLHMKVVFTYWEHGVMFAVPYIERIS